MPATRKKEFRRLTTISVILAPSSNGQSFIRVLSLKFVTLFRRRLPWTAQTQCGYIWAKRRRKLVHSTHTTRRYKRTTQAATSWTRSSQLRLRFLPKTRSTLEICLNQPQRTTPMAMSRRVHGSHSNLLSRAETSHISISQRLTCGQTCIHSLFRTVSIRTANNRNFRISSLVRRRQVSTLRYLKLLRLQVLSSKNRQLSEQCHIARPAPRCRPPIRQLSQRLLRAARPLAMITLHRIRTTMPHWRRDTRHRSPWSTATTRSCLQSRQTRSNQGLQTQPTPRASRAHRQPCTHAATLSPTPSISLA